MQWRIDPQKHNTRHARAAAEYKLSEILILGQKQPIFRRRAVHDCAVIGGRLFFRHVADVVSRAAKVGGQRGFHAFIQEPAHAQP
jgi:hypothetical protein